MHPKPGAFPLVKFKFNFGKNSSSPIHAFGIGKAGRTPNTSLCEGREVLFVASGNSREIDRRLFLPGNQVEMI